MKKQPTSMHLSPEAKALLAALHERLSMSRRAVVELAIRELAAKYGVKIDEK